jgi:transcription factor WhiB
VEVVVEVVWTAVWVLATTSAKRVCVSCLVRSECLAYSVATGASAGVFGRLTARERRAVPAGGLTNEDASGVRIPGEIRSLVALGAVVDGGQSRSEESPAAC